MTPQTEKWRGEIDDILMRFQIQVRKETGGNDWSAVDVTLIKKELADQLQSQRQADRAAVETRLKKLETEEYCCSGGECADQARYDTTNYMVRSALEAVKEVYEKGDQ